MTAYNPVNDQFPVVQLYDTTDPVIGGLDGESNIPIKQLAERTENLNYRINRYEDVVPVSGSIGLTNAHARKLMLITVTDNAAITIASTATFKVGDILSFKCNCPAGKAVSITPSQLINDGSITAPVVWLCDGESIHLVCKSSSWEVMHAVGNFEKVGNDDLVRFQPRNTIIANGALLNRVDYPRLYSKISTIAISDALWLSLTRYNGFFSLGNGTTTFRVPDMRSIFYRALDLGRGLDVDRLDASAGGYEADAFRLHSHQVKKGVGGGDTDPLDNGDKFHTNTGFAGMDEGTVFIGTEDSTNYWIKATGGNETRPKNIGLIPIIYY